MGYQRRWVVVGSSYTKIGSSEQHAFSFSGTPKDLNTLQYDSIAYAINNSGVAAGSAVAANLDTVSVIFDGSGVHSIGGLGGSLSRALDINDNGQVVGFSRIAGSKVEHAYFYSNGVMTDLGTLGATYSAAFDMNDAGDAIGAYGAYDWINQTLNKPFLYTGGTMYDLNSLIDPTSGWVLNTVTAINNLGQMVGVGTYGGKGGQAYLLSPVLEPPSPPVDDAVPEPRSWMMLIAGFGLAGTILRKGRPASRLLAR